MYIRMYLYSLLLSFLFFSFLGERVYAYNSRNALDLYDYAHIYIKSILLKKRVQTSKMKKTNYRFVNCPRKSTDLENFRFLS